MSVLSIIGGYVPGELTGTAPDASFWLLRSEDVGTEFIIEEDNWIAAAEFADSAGVDIINTSLGYSEFDDSLQNHTYAQMNGDIARISRAADIAASKGILVVVSAGNQGSQAWRYISAPADADSVLAIGAVDQSGFIAGFSSRGPSSDQQVKPTVMAIGQGTYVSALDGTIKQGNGTSYSAPVISGLVACLWQANPDAAAMELYASICKSADRFNQPNDDYGYGIPDFALAHVLLQTAREEDEPTKQMNVFPTLFSNQLYIIFHSEIQEPADVALFDVTGKLVFRKTYSQAVGLQYLKIEHDLDFLHQGAYILRVDAGDVSVNSKLIKF
jgi:subtilisin family serine protease